MDTGNRRGHNTNNNIRANGLHNPQYQLSTVTWHFVTQVAEVVFRMYLTVLVILYQWCVQVLSRLLAPLQPALDQARKVPKQDISLQGIVYQYMRLVFLLLLYFSPWLVRLGQYVLNPLKKLRDWAVDYVDGPLEDAAATNGKPTLAHAED
ncbi:hypothetical protein EGW08_001189 [Elysia chlorotica]|uniref:Uncharacterized protein n=1 Tax=Elysia chlorotica TaxID=188477 RepID=A0A3S1I2N8_ELYCH|nr:hypothetical protein EGW08_001189 [Elysia chlorotica]